jgi:hypothetical protein
MPLPNLKHPFWLWLGAGIVAIVVGWFLIGRLFPENKPGPTPSEKTSDSLAITKPIDQGLIDTSNAHIRARQPSSNAATGAARIAQDRANAARRRADSLAIAKAWEAAYIARTEERDSLTSVVASNATVIFNLKADTTDLRFQLGIVNKRLKTTEDVNAGLIKDLHNAQQCKIAHFINCPSRWQTAALTAAAIYGVQRARR